MCMALLTEWGMRTQGIVCGVIGMVLGLVTLLVWRKMEDKAPIKVSGKTVGTILLGVFGALLLGVGLFAFLSTGGRGGLGKWKDSLSEMTGGFFGGRRKDR